MPENIATGIGSWNKNRRWFNISHRESYRDITWVNDMMDQPGTPISDIIT